MSENKLPPPPPPQRPDGFPSLPQGIELEVKKTYPTEQELLDATKEALDNNIAEINAQYPPIESQELFASPQVCGEGHVTIEWAPKDEAPQAPYEKQAHEKSTAKHSLLGPSASVSWLSCGAYVKYNELLSPEQIKAVGNETPYAKEGRLAHDVAEKILKNEKLHYEKITPEMLVHLQKYASFIRACSEGGELFIEHRVDFGQFVEHPTIERFGRVDAAVYYEEKKHLKIIDLKYGEGQLIKAENNSQAMLYALGLLQELLERNGLTKKNKSKYPVKTIEIVIYQPRSYINHIPGDELHLERWNCTIEELLTFAASANLSAAASLADNPEPRPSVEACHYCKAKSVCPGFKDIFEEIENATKAVPVETSGKFKKSPLLSLEYIEKKFDKFELVKKWMKAAGSYLLARGVDGAELIDHKIVETLGNRSIDDLAVAKILNSEEFTPLEKRKLITQDVKAVTIAQAEKILGSKRKHLTAIFVNPGELKPAIAPKDSPKPEWKKVEDGFEVQQEEENKAL